MKKYRLKKMQVGQKVWIRIGGSPVEGIVKRVGASVSVEVGKRTYIVKEVFMTDPDAQETIETLVPLGFEEFKRMYEQAGEDLFEKARQLKMEQAVESHSNYNPLPGNLLLDVLDRIEKFLEERYYDVGLSDRDELDEMFAEARRLAGG